jgi:hypothetical protein
VDAPQPVVKVCSQSNNTLCVKKIEFLATFINCTTQVSTKSIKLDIVTAEGKTLGHKDFTSEDMQGVLVPEEGLPSEAPLVPV